MAKCSQNWLCVMLFSSSWSLALLVLSTAIRAVLGWGEAARFFGAGSTWAPQVRLPTKFYSCERDFNALSGWGAGSRVPRLREPFVYYLPGGTAGGIAFCFCKKRHVMPFICWTGPSYPDSNVPKPRLRPKIFRGRTWGSKPPFPR
jgi:hypothetical protein